MLRGKYLNAQVTPSIMKSKITRQQYFLLNSDTDKNENLSLGNSNEKVSNELCKCLVTNVNLTLDSVFSDEFDNSHHSDNNLNSVSDIVNDNLCDFSNNIFQNGDTHNFSAFTRAVKFPSSTPNVLLLHQLNYLLKHHCKSRH